MVSISCLKSGDQRMVATKPNEGKTRRTRQVDGPDGTSAWIVAVATCLINFIMAGLGRMSGILFVAFIETYGVDRRSASMPSSVRSSTGNLLGPVVGILGQKYGARSITMIGGIVATTSAVTCFLVNDITWVTILWGGLNGLGNALTVTLPQVVIGQYFDKYQTTASGMAFSGGCLGSFLFPVLLENLIHEYGLGGTFLILGGIIMHTIPAAMILRKPSWLRSKKAETSGVDDVECSKTKLTLDQYYMSDVRKELVKRGTIAEVPRNGPNLDILKQNSELVMKLLETVSAKGTEWTNCTDIDEKSRLHLESYLWAELHDVFRSIEEPEGNSRQLNLTLTRQDIFNDFYQKEPLKPVSSNRQFLAVDQPFVPGSLKKCSSVPDLAKASNNCNILHKLKDLYEMKLSDILAACPKENKRIILRVSRELKKLYHVSTRSGTCGKLAVDTNTFQNEILKKREHAEMDHSNSFFDHILTAFKLYLKPMFLVICLCRAVHFIAFIPAMTTVVDFVMDKGLIEQDGKYAIAALSLGDLLGRLCFGWVTDKGYLSMSKFMMTVMIAQGASTAFLPLMNTRLTIFVVLGIFGMLEGSLFVRHPVLISTYMDSHEQSIAMGCVNFISGLLGFGMPLYIGYFRDTLGSYDYIFHINGTMGACVGLLWIFEPYFLRSSPQKSDKLDNEKV
ncbi:monocarboxylate transporter 5 [Nephila pilipes]|uniref:Monocarboxylate transporter 5 n=1 Tax=Nephila pilipes TaxID=299642 RepID=A0A8X6QW45_NEPPI|nr:monocarboxylate transporter 5 [Nephila pilipes]